MVYFSATSIAKVVMKAQPKGHTDGHQLHQDLSAPAQVGEFTQGHEAYADEEAGGEHAPNSAHAVDRPNVEGVVEPDAGLQPNGGVAKSPGTQSDDHRGHGSHKPGGRSDGSQARHCSRRGSNDAGSPVNNPVEGDPDHRGS